MNIPEAVRRRHAVLDQLKSALVANLSIRFLPAEIDPDAPLFVSGLGLDSVDALEVVLIVEREFGVQIPDGDIATMRNLNYIADYVLSNAT